MLSRHLCACLLTAGLATTLAACSNDGDDLGRSNESESSGTATTNPSDDASSMPDGVTISMGEQMPVTGDQAMLDSMDPTALGQDADDTEPVADNGDLVPVIFASGTSVDPSIAQGGASLVEFFNRSLILPRDIPVNFIDCGTANAFYASDASEIDFPGPNIFLCHELTELFVDFYNGDTQDAFLASAFVFIHELGHALVDQLDLPVIGLEESYVDSVAAVFAGEGGMAEASLLAGQFFLAQGDSPFFDTHRVGAQRFGDLACYAIGSDPSLTREAQTQTIADQLVEAGRNCVAEYQQQLDGLTRVLSPFIRGEFGDPFASFGEDGFPTGMNPVSDDGDAGQSADGDIDGNQTGSENSADSNSTRVTFWDATDANGNILYIGMQTDANGTRTFILDFLGDAVDQGDNCYDITPHPRPTADFAVGDSGELLLDGNIVGQPVERGELPQFPACR